MPQFHYIKHSLSSPCLNYWIQGFGPQTPNCLPKNSSKIRTFLALSKHYFPLLMDCWSVARGLFEGRREQVIGWLLSGVLDYGFSTFKIRISTQDHFILSSLFWFKNSELHFTAVYYAYIRCMFKCIYLANYRIQWI